MNVKKRTLTQASLFSSFQQQQQQQQDQEEQEPIVNQKKKVPNDNNKKNDNSSNGSNGSNDMNEIRIDEQQLHSIDTTNTTTNNKNKNNDNDNSTNEHAVVAIDPKIDNSIENDIVVPVVTELSNKIDNVSSVLSYVQSSLVPVVPVPVPVPVSVSASLGVSKQKYTIYCDLDGVLVDFSQGVYNLIGKRSEEFGQHQQNLLWSSINKHTNFYKTLPWMFDGEELWNFIRPYTPIILSGVPRSRNNIASIDKFVWCKNELCCEVQHYDMAGPKYTHQRMYHPETNGSKKKSITSSTYNQSNIIKVITCWSKNKYMECKNKQYYSILIDDRIDNGQQWVQQGRNGIFIHHTSTKTTIEQLQKIVNN